MAWRNSALAGAMALLLGAGATQATVIYQAPEATNNLYANNQIGFAPYGGDQPGGISTAYGVGNTITFAGSGPFDLGTVDLYGYAGGGSKPIEVDLYAGTVPNVGAFLGSASATPEGNGWTTEVLQFDGLKVPQTLTYIVSIEGNSGSWDDSFVDWQQFTGVTGSPTIGTSGNMWYGSPGSFVSDNSYAILTGSETNALAVQFSAVPEPATWAMMLLGVGVIGAGLREARRKKDMALTGA